MAGRRRSTVVLVAERAGVSIASVSRVLNGLPTSHDVRRRVEAAAADLRYVPDVFARSLKVGQTHQIVLAVADVGNPVYVAMMHAVSGVLDAASFRLVLASTGNDPERHIELVRSVNGGYADGLILVPLRITDELIAEVSATRVPIVVGNVVNCRAAMYMAPVGVVNAGDPAGAYAEAIDMAGAHQSSYGREAAGVFAAAVAEAMRPGATIGTVVESALALARDGTRAAIEAVVDVAQKHHAPGGGDWAAAIADLREAVTPFDTVGPVYREPVLDARIPSRTKAIEELPVALGFVVVADGNVSDAILGGVNYGRDSDSIATMAGAIAGALGGGGAVPADWVAAVAEASRIDPGATATTMAGVTRDVWARDAERAEARSAARDAF